MYKTCPLCSACKHICRTILLWECAISISSFVRLVYELQSFKLNVIYVMHACSCTIINYWLNWTGGHQSITGNDYVLRQVPPIDYYLARRAGYSLPSNHPPFHYFNNSNRSCFCFCFTLELACGCVMLQLGRWSRPRARFCFCPWLLWWCKMYTVPTPHQDTFYKWLNVTSISPLPWFWAAGTGSKILIPSLFYARWRNNLYSVHGTKIANCSLSLIAIILAIISHLFFFKYTHAKNRHAYQ